MDDGSRCNSDTVSVLVDDGSPLMSVLLERLSSTGCINRYEVVGGSCCSSSSPTLYIIGIVPQALITFVGYIYMMDSITKQYKR